MFLTFTFWAVTTRFTWQTSIKKATSVGRGLFRGAGEDRGAEHLLLVLLLLHLHVVDALPLPVDEQQHAHLPRARHGKLTGPAKLDMKWSPRRISAHRKIKSWLSTKFDINIVGQCFKLCLENVSEKRKCKFYSYKASSSLPSERSSLSVGKSYILFLKKNRNL